MPTPAVSAIPPSFLVVCAVPIVAKWVLVGRWKSQEFPVWSLAYFRFWLAKTLIRANPMVLFVGSPLYLLYLRAHTVQKMWSGGCWVFGSLAGSPRRLRHRGEGACHPR